MPRQVWCWWTVCLPQHSKWRVHTGKNKMIVERDVSFCFVITARLQKNYVFPWGMKNFRFLHWHGLHWIYQWLIHMQIYSLCSLFLGSILPRRTHNIWCGSLKAYFLCQLQECCVEGEDMTQFSELIL